MTDDDPILVDVEHRGRRVRVPVVLQRIAEPDDAPDGVVASVTVDVRLRGGHELTDRFIEEMGEDMGPAEDEA